MSPTADASFSSSNSYGSRTSPFAFARILPWLLFLIPAIAGLAADLLTKAAAFPGLIDPTPNAPNGLHPFDPQPLIPKVLDFITIVNHGAVFGLGQGYGWIFIIFSVIALTAILFVFLRSRANQFVLHIALGLITAGALGNLYDRFTFGVVRDFMRFEVSWYQYIFNVADVLLCIGVPLLMLCWLRQPDPKSPSV